MAKRLIALSALLVLVLVAAVSLNAQTATGEIVGRVTDLHGAVIVGAKITARETATGMTRSTVTNAEGLYQIPALPPGNYEITSQVPNMAKGLVKAELLLGSHLPVNFTMHPGAASTTVEVTGEAAAVETTSSELKANIDPRQMTDLPLNGRTFASLAILAPEVRPVGSFDPTKSRIGTVSIGGSTGRNFNLTVDGGDNKDNIVGGFLQNYTTEGIQEFVIDTHKFGADTGKSGGGVVTIATKGGSNTLHGAAFGFLRNRNLNTLDYFTAHPNTTDPKTGEVVPCPPCYTSNLYPATADTPAQKITKAPFDRQNYGGSISGPIKKDKLFFFAAVEHTHETSSVAQNGEAVQTLTDFVALRQIAPLKTAELQTLPIDLSPYIPVPFLDTQFQGRVDWNASKNDQLFIRYAQQNNHLMNDQLTGWYDISQGATTINDLNSILANWTRVLNPQMLNQFSFQFSHFYNSMQATKVGNNIAELCFLNWTCLGMGENVPQTTRQNKFQFRDDFSWRKGKHALKFGVQNIYTKDVGGTIAYDVSPWVYTRCNPAQIMANITGSAYHGTDPGGCRGATSFDDPNLPLRSIGLAGGNPSYMQTGINQLSYYFQDDWKITSRLTLNLGVRNDIDFGLVPTDNQVRNRAVVLLKSIGLNPGIPSTDVNNWAPRVGFAYDVTGKGKWVLRGGYGLFFDQLFTNTILHATQQANADVYTVLYNQSYSSRASGVGVNGGLQKAINAVGMWPITSAPNLPYGSRGRYISPDFQTPYTQQFTIGTQFEIGSDMTVAVDYVHLLGLHEFAAREVNPAVDGSNDSRILNSLMDPIYGCVQGDGSIAFPSEGEKTCSGNHKLHRISEANSGNRSRYDSLTVNLKKRFNKRYSFGASYVLSRALGYSGAAFDWGAVGQGIYPGLTGWETALRGVIGPQNFGYVSEDERHRVVLNGIVQLPGGFTVSAIAQLSSGRPYTMYADGDANGDGVSNDVYSNVMSLDPVFDPQGYGDARYSVRDKNQLRGDPYYQTDLRVQKAFKFGERYKVTFLADIFNVFNRANFGNAFQNYADSFGDQQAGFDVPANVPGCPGDKYPCTFATAQQLPRKPVSLFGGGYGGAGTVGIPFQAQFGLRFSF